MTDAIQRLNEDQGVYAYDFEGIRYDVGEKLGFIMTTIEFALATTSFAIPSWKSSREYSNARK